MVWHPRGGHQVLRMGEPRGCVGEGPAFPPRQGPGRSEGAPGKAEEGRLPLPWPQLLPPARPPPPCWVKVGLLAGCQSFKQQNERRPLHPWVCPSWGAHSGPWAGRPFVAASAESYIGLSSWQLCHILEGKGCSCPKLEMRKLRLREAEDTRFRSEPEGVPDPVWGCLTPTRAAVSCPHSVLTALARPIVPPLVLQTWKLRAKGGSHSWPEPPRAPTRPPGHLLP